MSDLTLTPLQISAGIWEGILRRSEGGDDTPDIAVTHLGTPLPDFELTTEPDQPRQWRLRVPIPAALLSDGVQTFLITDRASETQLGAFSIAMGDILEGDIRAEIDLLRAELDMLKRAFRRHCLETA